MRINFYIKDKETEMIRYLCNHANRSRLIVELVKAHMKNENRKQLTEEDIIKLIKKHAGSNNVSSEEDIKEAIDSMF